MKDEEITRVVAEKVMGGLLSYDPLGVFVNGDGVIFEPLTDDADACAVLDKMAADGWRVTLDKLPDADWFCRFRRGYLEERAVEDCRRLAICVAALKAVGEWQQDGCIFCGAPMEVVDSTERFGEVLRCTARCIGGIGPGKAPKESPKESGQTGEREAGR